MLHRVWFFAALAEESRSPSTGTSACMHDQPPDKLLELLERLGLATAAQVQAVRGRVRRLARGLPRFESVWVDALAQARVLTPYQAAEINAGRGSLLAIAGMVIREPIQDLGYARAYAAGNQKDGRLSRLVVSEVEHPQQALAQLEAARRQMSGLDHPGILVPDACGAAGNKVWTTSRLLDAPCASSCVARYGRMPGEVVLELARQLADALRALETTGVVHGGISAHQVLLSTEGRAHVVDAALRPAVCPVVHTAACDLPPESCDYLAPEQISDAGGPLVSSDLFSLGALWWHLLAGRPPIAGATVLAKLNALQHQSIVDVRRFAPETPAVLAATIGSCTHREMGRRPDSMLDLAAMLGPATRQGQRGAAAWLQRARRPSVSLKSVRRRNELPHRATAISAAAAGVLLALTVVMWPIWGERVTAWFSRTMTAGLNTFAGDSSNHSGTVEPGRANPTGQGTDDDRDTGPPTGLDPMSDRAALYDPAARPSAKLASAASSRLGHSGLETSAAENATENMAANTASGDSDRDSDLIPGPFRPGGESARPITPRGDSFLEPDWDDRPGGPTGDFEFESDASSASQHDGPSVDARPRDVAPAGFSAEGVRAYEPTEASGRVLELPTDRPVRLERLTLRDGQWIRGQASARPLAVVPPEGLRISAEDVTFEGIDFLIEASRDEDPQPSEAIAIIRLRAQRATFRDCSFQGSARSASRAQAAAIDWVNPTAGEDAAALPTGELTLENCRLRRVSAGVVWDSAGAMVLRLNNTLHLGPGALLKLKRCPTSDEPIRVALDRVTLREALALLSIEAGPPRQGLGPITIQADDGVFAPLAEGALLRFQAADSAQSLAEQIDWNGQGCVLADRTALTAAVDQRGKRRPLDEAPLRIAGLVRSVIGFAGPADESPAASRLVRWRVPLHSEHPPGIEENDWQFPTSDP
jgi:serine/threonine protein kinase